MNYRCPVLNCISHQNSDPKIKLIIRNGSYRRSSDSRRIAQFYCKSCKKSFSAQTGKLNYRQKRRRITHVLFKLFNSGVSQRRAARITGANRKTVVRRFRYFSRLEELRHQKWLEKEFKDKKLSHIQFDDLETAEHTKCKPLSVALAIDPNTRKILGFQVNQMPAKGLLAKIAFKKYGYREDQRSQGWEKLMENLKPITANNATLHSDENPHYPRFVKKHHPEAIHKTVKGGRGAIGGQGELKKLIFDPLFSLNHTCAMLRANLNRLFRRTWCISKNKQGLIDHLWMYVGYHNRVLT